MTWKEWLSKLLQSVFSGAAGAAGSGTVKDAGGNAIGGAIGGAIGHVVTEPMPILVDPADLQLTMPIFVDFFSKYEQLYGPLNPSQRSGMEFLLSKLKADPNMEDARHKAYVLATVKHECADTWQPIEEYGKGKGRSYGVEVDGHVYYGRGFVQITWIDNYRKLGREIGEDLVREPWLALEPNAAYRILSAGMTRGMFTDNALSAFINDAGCDYLNARKIVNGLDKAEHIADFAVRIESCLR